MAASDLAAGYASFEEPLKRNRLGWRTTAFKLIAVAESYSPKQARSLGMEKAWALVSYTRATPAESRAASRRKVQAQAQGAWPPWSSLRARCAAAFSGSRRTASS